MTILDRALSEPVRITEGESARELPAEQAADLAQMNKAMQGDQSAFAAVIRRMIKLKVAVPRVDASKPRAVLVVRDHVSEQEWEEMLEALRESQAKIHAEGYADYLNGGPRDEC